MNKRTILTKIRSNIIAGAPYFRSIGGSKKHSLRQKGIPWFYLRVLASFAIKTGKT